jgi:LAS superfamily LD-carboxypeptidase LdcB
MIRRALGDDLVLTSGLRSVTKQFMLFLSKAARSGGNLSQASRSLAPPGYSFHGVGDFDVGQRGYGSDNFTWRFTESPVYAKLIDLGFTRLRYTEKNALGVRFEPWHIKVV